MVHKQSDAVSPKVADVLHDKVMQATDGQRHAGDTYPHTRHHDIHPTHRQSLDSSPYAPRNNHLSYDDAHPRQRYSQFPNSRAALLERWGKETSSTYREGIADTGIPQQRLSKEDLPRGDFDSYRRTLGQEHRRLAVQGSQGEDLELSRKEESLSRRPNESSSPREEDSYDRNSSSSAKRVDRRAGPSPPSSSPQSVYPPAHTNLDHRTPASQEAGPAKSSPGSEHLLSPRSWHNTSGDLRSPSAPAAKAYRGESSSPSRGELLSPGHLRGSSSYPSSAVPTTSGSPGPAMVTSTPTQSEDARKAAQRYSVESYPPSPEDPNDSLSKSGPDEDEDDDEFSDGGHYRSPGAYPPYLRETSCDNGDPPSPPTDREDRAMRSNMASGPEASPLESRDMMQRMFFEECLKNGGNPGGRYPLEYPLRGLPHRPYPPSSSASSPHHHPHRPPFPSQGRDYSTKSPPGSAEGPYANHPNRYHQLQHHHQQHQHRQDQHRNQQQHSPREGAQLKDAGYPSDEPDSQNVSGQKLQQVLRRPYETSRSFSEEGHRLEPMPMPGRSSLDSHRDDGRDNLLSPKKEPNTSFSSTDRDGQPAFPDAYPGPRREDTIALSYSPSKDGSSMHHIKRENLKRPGSPEMPSSPDSHREGGMTLHCPVSMVPSSSPPPPSKIPMPPTLPSGMPRGGYPPYDGEMPPLHEMMLAGGMAPGGHPPRFPLMTRMGAVPEGGGPPGHVYFCHLCSYSGASKDDFDNHMTIHFEYNCPHCDYTSRTEGRLKRHIKDFHTDTDGKSRTMPGRPKILRCKQCEFSCVDKVEFWSHAKTHIKEEKLLACPRCPFVTEYKHHLEYHLRNHFGSKPYKCGKCNYSCVNKSMLNSHMKSHTNVYQYRCADCTYATKYCHSLKLHLRKYSHKPATVLNSDGSLPQGIDAEISGLSLMAKRGPPRGPRGLRKDKDGGDGGGFVPPGFFPMPPSPHHPHSPRGPLPPGLNPMLGGGMLPPSPYWPLMAPNGMHPPPPPLIPHVGQHLPDNHSGPAGGRQDQEMRNSREWDREKEMRGGHPLARDRDLLCQMCSFSTSSLESLQAHVFKVHASENRDLLNMLPFNMTSSDMMNEEAVHKMQARRMSAPPGPSTSSPASSSSARHSSSLPDLDSTESYPRRNTVPSSSLSPMKARYAESSHGEQALAAWARKRDAFPGYVDNMFLDQQQGLGQDRAGRGDTIEGTSKPQQHHQQQRQQTAPAEEGADILRQMTLKFGLASSAGAMSQSSMPAAMSQSSMPAAAMSVAANMAEMTSRGAAAAEQGALDLTNKTSSSPTSHEQPPFLPTSHPGPHTPVFPFPSMPPTSTHTTTAAATISGAREKRPFSEVSGSTSLSEEANYSFASSDDSAASAGPTRKRSRKGKAYKLDTLYLKRKAEHEQQQQQLQLEQEEQLQQQAAGALSPAHSDSQDAHSHEDDMMITSVTPADQEAATEEGPVDMPPYAVDAQKREGGCDDDNNTAGSHRPGSDPEELQDRFIQLQKELQMLNSETPAQSVAEDSGNEGSEPPAGDQVSSTEGPPSAQPNVGSSPPLIIERDALEDSAPSQTAGEGQQLGEVEEEDLEKEKESMIKAICQNRRQPVDPSVRRGTELAWKIMTDPSTGVELPPEIVEETQPPMPIPAMPIPAMPQAPHPSSASSMTPRKNGMNSRSLSGCLEPSMSPGKTLPTPSSALTSPKNGYDRNSLAGCLTSSSNTSPSSAMNPFANYMAMQEASRGMILPGSASFPERLSTHVQTVPPFNHMMDRFARPPHLPPAAPPVPRPPAPRPPPPQQPPPGRQHQYECTHCDMGFKDMMMYSMHMAYHNEAGNPFQCRGCGYSCHDKREFFLHIVQNPHS